MSRTTGILVVIFCSLLLAVLSGPMASAQQPPNDFCAGALPITGEVDEFFLTFGATTDSSLFDVGACGFDRIFNDVWYCYTATATGTCIVSTCQNAFFDTRIAVFNGCSCPADPSNVVSCNDNCPADTVNGTSTAIFDATAGSQYLICIGSASPVQFGEGSFTVSCGTPCDPAEAIFSADPISGTAPLQVSFRNFSFGTEPIEWEWNFGDNSPVSNAQTPPPHVYTNPGTYNVTLLAENACGTSDFVVPIVVGCEDPMADFAASNTLPLTVAFTNNSTGTGLTSTWQFGDNTTSSVTNPIHIYNAPGPYTVTLVVTDACNIDHGTFLKINVTDNDNSPYLRGDSNGDGQIDIADVVYLLVYLFGGGLLPCPDAGDVNDDGVVNIADAIFLLTYLFGGNLQGDQTLPPPFGSCGLDPTDDNLDCESFDVCD